MSKMVESTHGNRRGEKGRKWGPDGEQGVYETRWVYQICNLGVSKPRSRDAPKQAWAWICGVGVPGVPGVMARQMLATKSILVKTSSPIGSWSSGTLPATRPFDGPRAPLQIDRQRSRFFISAYLIRTRPGYMDMLRIVRICRYSRPFRTSSRHQVRGPGGETRLERRQRWPRIPCPRPQP